MTTTEHATNEQMAIILGWIKHEGPASWYWSDSNDQYVMQYKDFNPIVNLNHTARVEARLAELGLINRYVRALARLTNEVRAQWGEWGFIHASAQTRCDAAWATWQQYQRNKG